MTTPAHAEPGTSLPEDHSSPALKTLVPGADVPNEAQYDTLSTPTIHGRRRPTQHLNPDDDFNAETGE
jgi:hypothetical protein